MPLVLFGGQSTAGFRLNAPLNLPRRNGPAAGRLQLPLGFQRGRRGGSCPTNELGQRWRIAHFQTPGGLGGSVASSLAWGRAVISLQLKGAEEALHPDSCPALARLSGFGRVAGIGPVRSLLEQPADQRVGGFENRRAHQDFPVGDALAMHLPGFKAGDQLLDFFFLRQENRGRGGLFFLAAAMFGRVSWMTKSAYCSGS